jgi:hypothetical protein
MLTLCQLSQPKEARVAMVYDALVRCILMKNQAGPPEGFKIIKLPPNGPKPGQSTRAWLYGKGKEEKKFQKLIDAQSFKGKHK